MGWLQLKEGRSFKVKLFFFFSHDLLIRRHPGFLHQGIHGLLIRRHPGLLPQGIHDLLNLRHPGFFIRASTTYLLCVILASSSGHPRLTYSASSWLLRQGIHDLLTLRHPGCLPQGIHDLLTLRHPGFLLQGIHDLLTLRHPDSSVRVSSNQLMCLV